MLPHRSEEVVVAGNEVNGLRVEVIAGSERGEAKVEKETIEELHVTLPHHDVVFEDLPSKSSLPSKRLQKVPAFARNPLRYVIPFSPEDPLHLLPIVRDPIIGPLFVIAAVEKEATKQIVLRLQRHLLVGEVALTPELTHPRRLRQVEEDRVSATSRPLLLVEDDKVLTPKPTTHPKQPLMLPLLLKEEQEDTVFPNNFPTSPEWATRTQKRVLLL